MTPPISWNTGRAYSETGQLIFAKVLPDSRVAFHDATRGVTGITNRKLPEGASVQAHVMGDYDRNQYTDSSSSEWYQLTKDD